MKTCLVVDDSRVVRAVARNILEDLNFEVTEADNGRTALDACLRRMPDVVLLDWNMPVMSGIEFLRELRAIAGDHAPIVVFCTTNNDVSQIQEGVAAGANEYIMKPFDAEIVEAKLRQAGAIAGEG
jgi:two-component system chemotaxis response regulator CheY